ncbi:PREDICTED: ankyrin repeat, PH and SEC7 domain containing protein secG-like [Camelina sativa]|uniref:Ankyrin repeat, PH and SEC7 domain containing protein secG-like n=1 Tax=Camelina sativa TaxID=90675 RepID=A0ABM1QKM3_CAMSA|nr:PREDICTED: ankyrin repeat, PH and SEC7 domain containing protein secG-like [Camelina sativa]
MDRRLAWVTQSIDALYSLVDKDPFILQKIEASPYVHTPLHEASMFGKIDMAIELMVLMPSFTYKLNTRGYSPLHLAVENNQVEIALELVKFDPNLVRLRGRGGVTPLHLVVEKGGVNLLTEFIMAFPKSILDVNVSGETALHMAVLNGRYEEIKVLTGWIERMRQREAASMEKDILNRKDREGNTALHVAAYQNKHQAVKPLLKCLSLDRNIQNKDGLTSLDILRANGRYMDKDTEKLIRSWGGKSKAALPKVKTSSEYLSRVTFREFCSIQMTRYKSGISDGTRNALQVITILITTATYTTALQPPRCQKGDYLMEISSPAEDSKAQKSDGFGRDLVHVRSRLSTSSSMNKSMDEELATIMRLVGVRKGVKAALLIGLRRSTKGSSLTIFRARLICLLLWGFITISFYFSMFLNFILLPPGRGYTWFYILIATPLCCSYGIAMLLNGQTPESIPIFLVIVTLIGFLCYLIFVFLKWKLALQLRTVKPKSQMVLEGLSTI